MGGEEGRRRVGRRCICERLVTGLIKAKGASKFW